MRNLTFLFLVFLWKTHASEQATSYDSNMQSSTNQLTDNIVEKAQDKISKLVDKLADKLMDRFLAQDLQVVPLHHENLMGTTLANLGHLAAPSRTSLRSVPALRFMHSGGNQLHSRVRPRDVTAAQGDNGMKWNDPNGGMYGEGAKFEKGLFGEDFGARDATAGEIESNFGSKLMYGENYDTDHIKQPPDVPWLRKLIGVSAWPISEENSKPLDEDTIDEMTTQIRWDPVPLKEGDKVNPDSGRRIPTHFKLVRQFELKDEAAPKLLEDKFQKVAQDIGHSWLKLEHPDSQTVRIELQTKECETVTNNDLILASNLNDVPISQLERPRTNPTWSQFQEDETDLANAWMR